MRFTQRQVALVLLLVQAIGIAIILIIGLSTGIETASAVGNAIALVCAWILLIAYWFGWQPALPVTIFIAAIAVPFSAPLSILQEGTSIFSLLPVILALVLSTPRNIVLSGILIYGLLIWRAGMGSAWALPQNVIGFTLCTLGILLGRLVLDTALRRSEDHARQAEAARIAAERQAETLDRQARALEQRNLEQRTLLELVATLEVPIVRMAEGVLFAPIVGQLTTQRSQALTNRLLESVHNQRARYIILDIAGVAVMDSRVAVALIDAARALRLLGCVVAISGISAVVAATLVNQGIDLQRVRTVRDPSEALAYFQTIAASR